MIPPNIVQYIGSGTTANVYKQGGIVIKKSKYEHVGQKITRQRFRQERKKQDENHRIITKLNHPNILQLLDCRKINQDQWWYQLPLCEKMNLFQYFCKQKELYLQEGGEDYLQDLLVKITQQILSALKCMYNIGMIHRDICEYNVLYIQENKQIIPKICDFGSSRTRSNLDKDVQDFYSPYKGTADHYLCDLVKSESMTQTQVAYGHRLDVWQFGRLLLRFKQDWTSSSSQNESKWLQFIQDLTRCDIIQKEWLNLTINQAIDNFLKIKESIKKARNA